MKDYNESTRGEKIFSIILGAIWTVLLVGIGYLAIMAAGSN